MALIECIECKGKVSDLAENCPHCGAPVAISVNVTPKMINCFECNESIKEDTETCPNCGVPQSLKGKVKDKKIAKEEPKVEEEDPKEAKNEEKVKPKPEEKQTKKEPQPEPNVIVVKEKKKRSMFARIATIIGGLMIFIVVGGVIFMSVASDETKEKLFRGTFMEEAGIDRKIYVKCEVLEAHKNLMGTKWVITGKFYATSEKQNYTSETVTFHFTDGEETFTYNINLNGSQMLARPFQTRIEGHQNAEFIRAEVIDAN
ncbi:MAG: RNA polymerase subunit RPABC4/transcription elongation factor Spt4 [Crocinitomicaceae bacterium]|jgi:RNA polymerase subunit RPABC4/transcription elongation factor Spt4